MTLPSDTIHKTEIIDQLIVRGISEGLGDMDDIFLYVSTRYSRSNSVGFFFVVENQLKSLKRKKAIVYDRASKRWSVVAESNLADA
jgi:hypothetical protein